MWKRKLYLVLSLICFCLQFVRLCRWNMISIIQIFYVFLQLKVWKIYMIRFLNINSTTNFLNNLVFNFFNYFFPVKMMWFSFKWWSLDFISLVTNMNWLIIIVAGSTFSGSIWVYTGLISGRYNDVCIWYLMTRGWTN